MTAPPAPTEASVHRLEVLPGADRYAVTFRYPHGAEATATVRLADPAVDAAGLEVAAASLPAGWRPGDEAFAMLAAAVRALAAAATCAPATLRLTDVAGGWDVSLGNVVLNAADTPECTAHGALVREDADTAASSDLWVCAECGARARLAR